MKTAIDDRVRGSFMRFWREMLQLVAGSVKSRDIAIDQLQLFELRSIVAKLRFRGLMAVFITVKCNVFS